MFFIFIVGTRFFTWGSEHSPQPLRCGKCGATGQFTVKSGMQFITLFFIVPVLPISGVKKLLECPTCKARYEATA